MKYEPKFQNFMGVARENLKRFEHEHGKHAPGSDNLRDVSGFLPNRQSGF